MKNKWKKLLAGTLAATMVMGMLSVGTLAAEEEEKELDSAVIEQVEEKEEVQEVEEVEETDEAEEESETGLTDHEEEQEELPEEEEELPEEEEILEEEPILAGAPVMENTMATLAEEEVCEHDWVYDHCWMATEAKIPNCQTAHTDVYRCTKCSATETRNGQTHSHKMTYEDMNRFSHNAKCELCVWSEPYRDHKYSEPTCTTPATCVCGRTQGEVNPDNHVNIVTDKAVAATCTKTGLTEGTHCGDCGEVLEAQEETPLAAHTVVTDRAVEATCTRPGKTEGSHCSVCGEVLVAQEETPLAAHTKVIDEEVPATCTRPGKTEGSHCSVCNTVLEAQTETELVPHKWGEGEVTKVPTKDEPGVMTFTCTECKTTRTESIAWEAPVVAKIVREGEDVTFETLQAAVTAATEGETVILLENVTENVTATNKNNITLNLDGHTVNGGNNGTVLTINGGNVTLTGSGTITGGTGYNGKQGGGLYIKGNATVTMENGTITGNHVNEQGGGVFIDEGTFTMKDGTISENTAKFTGGGVFVYNFVETKSALFVMEGGTISGNTANGGAGVGAYGWKQHDENLHVVAQLNGGVIENNTAQNGGGVVMECGDTPEHISTQYGATGMNTMEINGVTIRNNHANLGGGVYNTDAVLKINGATITGNFADQGAKNYGGGVYVQGGSATLANVDITGNSANFGGGIYAGHNTNDTIVTMTSGKLYGNTVTTHSADIYCNAKTTLILPDASKMGGKLNGHSITDWFWDNTGEYDWGGSYVWTRGAGKTTAKQCLIAAYDPRTWYTVTYTDGVEDAEIFADKVIRVPDGAATPAFGEDPTRENYIFKGWDKELAETVTGDVTYVAQWAETTPWTPLEPATKLFTVTYTDGVEDAEIFADQVKTVKEGEATPAFEGTPTRTGYTFTGWNPAVRETVTENVTYTAQWSLNASDNGGDDGDDDDNDRPVRPNPDPSEEPTEAPEETPEIVEDLPEEDVPLAEVPEMVEELTEEEVPLAETPVEVEELEENEVPLAEVPETGDSMGLWTVMAILSAFGLAFLGLKKREEV